MIAAGEQLSVQTTSGFQTDALDVLGSLRAAMTGVVSSISGLRKPADVQKALKLDWTLSWQVFQIAGAGATDASTLGVGAKVPSRSSLKRFLDAAEAKGVETAKVERVWTHFDRFETLVETHAGDRTSFISMVSAAAGLDAEWLSADAQHRRNAYRAMSHVVGMQAVAKHICGIYDEMPGGHAWNLGVVVGYVGLRMLRVLPSALVFRMRILTPVLRQTVHREGLGTDPTLAGGYLMPDFSTNPIANLRTRELDAGWLVSELDKPPVGNQGACTLRFGTAYRGHPVPGDGLENEPFDGDVVVDKPVEVIFSDALVKPGLMRGAGPQAHVLLGNSHADTAALPGDVVPVLGDHRVEFLGLGPDSLATPDIPDYPALMRAAAARLGTDVGGFEAWRLRLEFPIYQATVRMRWQLPPTA